MTTNKYTDRYKMDGMDIMMVVAIIAFAVLGVLSHSFVYILSSIFMSLFVMVASINHDEEMWDIKNMIEEIEKRR